MRLLIQRVKEARVEVAGRKVGAIGGGLLLFLGIHKDDDSAKIPWLVNKVVSLRCFADEKGKMNRSVTDVQGGVLVVSQFTLYANCTAGRRPDFLEAASGETAANLYHQFVSEIQKKIDRVATGEFGAHMEISLSNDGPVTFLLER